MLESVLYIAFVLAAVFLGWRFWRSVRQSPRIRDARKQSGGVYYFTSTEEPVGDFFTFRRVCRPGRAVPVLVFWLASLWIVLSSLGMVLNPGAPMLNFLLSVGIGFPLVFISMVWVAKS